MFEKPGNVIGFIIGVVAIFGAFILEGGSLNSLFLLPALIIVFGGTFAATIIGFGIEKFRNIFNLIRIAYTRGDYNINRLINSMVEISIKGRQEGLLAIEKDVGKLEYHFPRKMFRFALAGADTPSLENIAMSEMRAMRDRHYSNIVIFNKMGGYAPTMGILGTVMALIMTLANAGSEPEVLIRSIASAFIATLWGVLSANLIWLPIADRLKQCHLEEKHMMEISLEGIIAIQSGEIPSIIRSRLMSMLPQSEQKDLYLV